MMKNKHGGFKELDFQRKKKKKKVAQEPVEQQKDLKAHGIFYKDAERHQVCECDMCRELRNRRDIKHIRHDGGAICFIKPKTKDDLLIWLGEVFDMIELNMPPIQPPAGIYH